MRIWEPQADYRTKATGSVALAALALLFPFVLVSLVQEAYVMAAGTAGIVAMLAVNVWLVANGRDYEKVTLYGLVPAGMLFMTHVFSVDGIIGGVWCYPATLACHCMLERRRAVVANAAILAIALPMIWTTLEPALSARFSATLLAVSLFASILVREIDAQQRRLRFQVEHDPLTGLLNRTTLPERLQGALERRAIEGTPAALLSLDLDHFKSINDRFGHEIGDRVLREVARLLRECTSVDDDVFRMGGEEFLVLLGNCDAEPALARAESLRATIEGAGLLQHHRVTASVGVAAARADDQRTDWVRRSDDLLYTAKREGRNRVVWQSESNPHTTESTGRIPLTLAEGL